MVVTFRQKLSIDAESPNKNSLKNKLVASVKIYDEFFSEKNCFSIETPTLS